METIMHFLVKLFPPKKLGKIEVQHLRETLSWHERITRGVDPNPQHWSGKARLIDESERKSVDSVHTGIEKETERARVLELARTHQVSGKSTKDRRGAECRI